MGEEPTLSKRELLLLEVFLDQPDVWRTARQLADAAGLKSGTIFPELAHLELHNWVTSRSEDPAAAEGYRYPRRYWRLTDNDESQRSARRAATRARAKQQRKRRWSARPGEVYSSR